MEELFLTSFWKVLLQNSIKNFFFASGLRCFSLLTSFDKALEEKKAISNNLINELINEYWGIDERSLAFMALGAAQRHQNPSCLVCTSGSALSNFYPCVLESHYGQGPLIIISADRLPEEVLSHGNQSINQSNFFQEKAYFLTYAPHQDNEKMLFIIHYYVQLLQKSSYKKILHINIPLTNPTQKKNNKTSTSFLKHLSLSLPTFCVEKIQENSSYDLNPKQDVLFFADAKGHFASSLLDNSSFSALFIKKIFDWQTLGGLCYFSSTFPLRCFFKNFDEQQFNQMKIKKRAIHIGGNFINEGAFKKRLLSFEEYWKISSEEEFDDPTFSLSKKILASHEQFWSKVTINSTNAAKTKNNESFLKFKKNSFAPLSSEEGLIALLGHLLPVKSNLFLGNSSSIRIFEHALQNDFIENIYHLKKPLLFHQRGVSGIEGHLSYFTGLMLPSAPIIPSFSLGLIGDLSFFYDLSSLLLFEQNKQFFTPHLLVVLNDSGGGIFTQVTSFQSEQEQKILEKIVCRHDQSIFADYKNKKSWNSLSGLSLHLEDFTFNRLSSLKKMSAFLEQKLLTKKHFTHYNVLEIIKK